MNLPSRVEQQLFETAEEAATGLATAVAVNLRLALTARPLASLLVSGGRSPIPFFKALSREPLDWSRVILSLADERWVDAAHDDSNGRLVQEHLLQNEAAAAVWIPLKTAEDTPEAGIATLEDTLADLPLPVDVLVLGVGDDGHTASLFPCADETPQALVSTSRFAAIHPRTAPHARITFTLPLLLDSRAIFVAISGDAKRAVLEQAVTATPPLPSGLVLLNSRNPAQVFWSP